MRRTRRRSSGASSRRRAAAAAAALGVVLAALRATLRGILWGFSGAPSDVWAHNAVREGLASSRV